MLAVDLVEHPDKGMVVNEINHTMEFHTMQPVSGVDIAGEIVEYVVSAAKVGIGSGVGKGETGV